MNETRLFKVLLAECTPPVKLTARLQLGRAHSTIEKKLWLHIHRPRVLISAIPNFSFNVVEFMDTILLVVMTEKAYRADQALLVLA